MRFYDEVIALYKGALEEWYVAHQSLWTYFMLIGLTVWVVLFPQSKAVGWVFGSLPKPEPELARALG